MPNDAQEKKKAVAFQVGNHVKTRHGWSGQIVDVRIVGKDVVFDVEHDSGYPTNPFLIYELEHV